VLGSFYQGICALTEKIVNLLVKRWVVQVSVLPKKTTHDPEMCKKTKGTVARRRREFGKAHIGHVKLRA